MKLPIDVIPGTRPPRFRWRQTVTSPAGGTQTVEHEGMLPPALEGAIAELVAVAKTLVSQCDKLEEINVGFAARIAAQSELLSKRAETTTTEPRVVTKKK